MDIPRRRIMSRKRRLQARPVGVKQRVFMDLCEILMVRKHMLGIKERAEALAGQKRAALNIR